MGFAIAMLLYGSTASPIAVMTMADCLTVKESYDKLALGRIGCVPVRNREDALNFYIKGN